MLKLMPLTKHLPRDLWPQADCDAFEAAYRPGDIFDDASRPW
jgi:hypothetical protein